MECPRDYDCLVCIDRDTSFCPLEVDSGCHNCRWAVMYQPSEEPCNQCNHGSMWEFERTEE